MNSEMVRRAAKAVERAHEEFFVRGEKECGPIHEFEARAAIAAMREPTTEMTEAGGAAFLNEIIGREDGDKANRPFIRYWRGMIDEALK